MARHDREESLEEQLAWLDAIKEQEEAPVVAAKSAAVVEDAVISPYPKDPWSSVPTESDATSSPLFRAAVDSAYQPASASTTVIVPPAEDADAAEWMEVSETVSAFTVPPPSASTKQDNDGFLAPLKPLPRQEPGDADTYTPSEFTEPAIRTPYVEPEPEPSRGLFEQPHRPAEPAEPFKLVPARPLGPDTGSFEPTVSETQRFTFGSSEFGGKDSGRSTSGGADSASGTGQFAVGGTDSASGTGQFAVGDADSASGTGSFAVSDAESDRFTPGGADSASGTGQFAVGGTDSASGTGQFAVGGVDSGRSTSDGADSASGTGQFAVSGTDSASGTGQFAVGGAESDRFTSGGTDSEGFTDGGEHDRDRSIFKAAEPAEAKESPRTTSGHFGSEPVEPFRTPQSFGADRPQPAPSPDRSAPDRSAPGSFGSDFSGPQDSPGFSGFSGPSAFGRERDTAFGPSRDTPSPADRPSFDRVSFDRADRVSPDRAEQVPTGRDTVSAPERETAFAPGPDTITPAREPYQARRRQSPVPPPAFSTPSRPQVPGVPRQSADSLDPESLLKGRRNSPAGGWRKLIYKASAGLIKPGESPEVRRRRELVSRARTPVATGHHRVAVLSLKGGVGKTTTTVGLGATLAQVRGDRVIAVDANPDRGTLSDKVELETSATVRDLLNERQQIKRYVDIRAFTSQAPSRLEILASDRDPSVSEAFSASDYQSVSQVLENFYSICITDCGTGLLHSAMSGVLGLADQLVLVSSPSVDGARAASATLDWLEAHHYEDLVRSATVVLCSVRPRSKSTVDLDRLEAHFAARCRAVIRVPYDPHLEEGAEIDLERLQPATRESYLRLAASVGDGFAGLQS
ncbi:AAA family ATPase [Streptosporangium lutulentum]|uniref:MinD-like ATPase involved in chromosome partitioning or flagellar assembly n=1 Tax=Streptosporangium lutulentum TaxID=1461250 RepID=A0ABT9QLY7_9ACTN|nr:AAA family ATPase [Streptosporangium lutulentum]MDP9847787.1 MinD-like ATPase involved in chromosome partitioning or flagellar assembly [Streptosporangium lutulentum]